MAVEKIIAKYQRETGLVDEYGYHGTYMGRITAFLPALDETMSGEQAAEALWRATETFPVCPSPAQKAAWEIALRYASELSQQ